MRKFADKQRTDVSTTESTLILSGSSPDTRGSWPIIKMAYKISWNLSLKISKLAYQIINTAIFKRLKSILQLQAVHEVFPTASHSRFEHSLGVMHLARKLCLVLGAEDRDRHLVEVAGLCHDLGHGPYSHLWEHFVEAGVYKQQQKMN